MLNQMSVSIKIAPTPDAVRRLDGDLRRFGVDLRPGWSAEMNATARIPVDDGYTYSGVFGRG